MNFKLPSERHLEDVNEEFNNFLHRATEVQTIVKRLASTNQQEQAMGMADAERVLNAPETNSTTLDNEEEVVVHVKSDRTVLNRRALHAPEPEPEQDGQQSTMSQEAWMEQVSKDAEARHKDRLVRLEKMETLKVRGNNAFRRGDYEQALCSYNKAIEHIKDSPLLYNNRALTHIKLGFPAKALEDLHWALRLNENGLRSLSLKAKCFHLMGDDRKFQEVIDEAKERLPIQTAMIDQIAEDIRNEK